MAVNVERLSGDALKATLPDLARLRISVFRDWPYLYEGTLKNEQAYMTKFATASGTVIIVARDGASIVGAATAAPLLEHTPSFAPLFLAHGLAPETIFYFGESVLLSAYRGQGIGHAFFDQREQAAREARTANDAPFAYTSFCGVVRAADHPKRPADYRSLDAFWMKRGYAQVDGLVGSYGWVDVGDTQETQKPMQFWLRKL